MKYYIRFGDIPKDEISKFYRGDAYIKDEKGVSVWDSAMANDIYFPILPQNPSEGAVQDYFHMIWGNRPVYLVTGDEISERGACGEPLLTNVQIIKDLTDDYKYQKHIFANVIN